MPHDVSVNRRSDAALSHRVPAMPDADTLRHFSSEVTASVAAAGQPLLRERPSAEHRAPAARVFSVREPWAKRGIDVVAAFWLLVMLAPLLMLIALAIRLQGGPALYGHRRVGRNLRAFQCLKFRTMRTDGDAVLARLLDEDADARREWRETRKLRNDPRVTRLGRLLRRTSLDELPQLINVLQGEMSLVGPRPVVREELDRHYGPAAAAYALVRPGITGLWQVSGRSDTSYSARVAFDTEYVATMSMRLDFAILFRTIAVVLARRGAV